MQEDKYRLEQVAIRMVAAPPLYSDTPVHNAADVVRLLLKEFEDYDREVVSVVNLRGDGAPINMNIVSMGSVNFSLASTREIFKSAILSNAAHILLAHNHPSGSVLPSRTDIVLTEKVLNAADLMDIPLLDHVILGRDGKYFSFRENNLLDEDGKALEKLEKAESKSRKQGQKDRTELRVGRVAEQKAYGCNGAEGVEKASILGEIRRGKEQIRSGLDKSAGRVKQGIKHGVIR